MPTSNTKPQQSAATDSPLGAPSGNEPYKTIRVPNFASTETSNDETDKQPGEDGGKEAEDLTEGSAPIGNVATGSDDEPEPKPAQGA